MLKTSLRYFVAVARRGSIRAACTELNVAQSAVSRQVQALEREVGAALFRRGRRGMALTEDGALLLALGQAATDDFAGLAAEIAEIGTLERGHVEVACVEEMVAGVLPAALGALKSRHPAVTVGVGIGTTDQVVAKVRAGEADLGIAFAPAPVPRLRVACCLDEALLAVMAPGHPLAGRGHASVRDLASWPLALPPPDDPVRGVVDRACARGRVDPRPVFETNSPELLRRYVEGSDAVTVLVRHAVAPSVAQGRVVALGFDPPGMAVPLQVLVPRRRTLPPASREMMDTLIRLLGAPAAAP